MVKDGATAFTRNVDFSFDVPLEELYNFTIRMLLTLLYCVIYLIKHK